VYFSAVLIHLSNQIPNDRRTLKVQDALPQGDQGVGLDLGMIIF